MWWDEVRSRWDKCFQHVKSNIDYCSFETFNKQSEVCLAAKKIDRVPMELLCSYEQITSNLTSNDETMSGKYWGWNYKEQLG